MNDLIAVLPELLLIGSALALLIYGAFSNSALATARITNISFAALVLAGLLALFDLAALKQPDASPQLLFGGLLAYDAMTALGRALVFFTSAFGLWLAQSAHSLCG